VRATDGLALGGVLATHPRLGSLNVYQWVLFVGGHETRHAAQIREIGEALRARDRVDAAGTPPDDPA
jgi:hypothetical protein